jgi:KaiC/GvpD/RAD55 family RecA-like ATPase
VIFITTERTSRDLLASLRQRGLGETKPQTLAIVDAYTQTVGLACSPAGNTLCANCADLNSLSMAVTKLQGRLNGKGTWLVFDSLTSPNLFSGLKVVKFIQHFLAKYALEGNAVVVAMDEGCGQEGDLGAMMSIADGIVRLEMMHNRQVR